MRHETEKQILFVILFWCAACFVPASARAAKLRLDPENAVYRPGQQVSVKLVLDTEEESVNAVEADIVYPAENFQFVDATDAGSVLNLWPQIPKNNDGKISFAGIVTGGYRGRNGLVATFVFNAVKETDAGAISVGNAAVLKNDGNGTPAALSVSGQTFRIKELGSDYPYATSSYQNVAASDTNPPEKFFPQVARSESIFAGNWFIVFNTQDKGSGVDHYEVQENRANKPDSAKWKIAVSPYLLTDQKLQSYIFVKAVDKAGNGRLEIIPPRYEKRGVSFVWYAEAAIILIILVLLYIRRKMARK